MKVWAVCQWWEYEGFAEPNSIYSTKEKADEVAAVMSRDCSEYSGIEVIEYEVDVGESQVPTK
jgi:hypothetical protein